MIMTRHQVEAPHEKYIGKFLEKKKLLPLCAECHYTLKMDIGFFSDHSQSPTASRFIVNPDEKTSSKQLR